MRSPFQEPRMAFRPWPLCWGGRRGDTKILLLFNLTGDTTLLTIWRKIRTERNLLPLGMGYWPPKSAALGVGEKPGGTQEHNRKVPRPLSPLSVAFLSSPPPSLFLLLLSSHFFSLLTSFLLSPFTSFLHLFLYSPFLSFVLLPLLLFLFCLLFLCQLCFLPLVLHLFFRPFSLSFLLLLNQLCFLPLDPLPASSSVCFCS